MPVVLMVGIPIGPAGKKRMFVAIIVGSILPSHALGFAGIVSASRSGQARVPVGERRRCRGRLVLVPSRRGQGTGVF